MFLSKRNFNLPGSKAFSTNQNLSSLFITPNGDIFIGTNYWLLLYHFSKKFQEKSNYHIGSKINHIDIQANEDGFQVALATYDGFVHFLQIDDHAVVQKHIRTSVFHESSELVSINDDTIICAGGDSSLSILTINDHATIKKTIQKKHKITALKAINNRICVGYQNGLIEILNHDLQKVKGDIIFNDPVIEIDWTSVDPVFITAQNYYQYNPDLKSIKTSIAFDTTISKAKVQHDSNNTRLFISDNKNVYIYENGSLLKPIENVNCVDAAFIGDYLFLIEINTGVMIPIYNINAVEEQEIEEEESDDDFD